MRAVMLRIGIAAIVLGACDATFNIEEVHRVDAAPDAPAEICLEDGFDGDMLDKFKWTRAGSPGGVSTVGGGQLSISVPESTSADQDPYVGIQSDPRDYSGVTAEVELVQVPGDTATSEAIAQFKIDGTTSYQIFVQRKQLVARKLIAGVVTDTQIAYAPTLHRFLRMRHLAETNEMVYEARALDTEWTQFAVASATAPLTTSTFHLLAGSFNVAPAFTAVFDNVRITGRCTF